MLSDTIDSFKNYYFPYGEIETKRVANLSIAVISTITFLTLVTLQVNQTFAWNVALHNLVQHQVVPFVMDTLFSEVSFGFWEIPVWMLVAVGTTVVTGALFILYGLTKIFLKPYKDNPESIRDYLEKSARLGDVFHVLYPDNTVTIYLAACDNLKPNNGPVKIRLEGKTVKNTQLAAVMNTCREHWNKHKIPHTLPAIQITSNYKLPK